MNIIEKIKKARKDKKLRQEDFADIIGVTRSVYTRKEKGTIPFKAEEIEILNNKLNLNLSFSDNPEQSMNDELVREALETIKDLRNDKKILQQRIKELETKLLGGENAIRKNA